MTVALIVIVVLLVVGAVLFVVARPKRRPALPAPKASPDAPAVARTAAPPRVEGLGARIRAIFAGAPTEDAWARLEDLLIRADVGPKAAEDIVRQVRDKVASGADPADAVAQEVAVALGGDTELHLRPDELSVVMVVGVNGTGKTTTIGKLAAMLGRQGKKVSLANSDTFRAAASEQLGVWADRAGAHLVAQSRGADPGAVAYDAVQAARARGSDVLIVDTAGRLHTRQPLMDELAKVKRVLEKAATDVEEVLLVLDATTGQNGIQQARVFTDAVQVTGIALTKMDGTAKGGIVVAVRDELGVPVKLIGTGERLDDLEPFDPKAFADRLVRA